LAQAFVKSTTTEYGKQLAAVPPHQLSVSIRKVMGMNINYHFGGTAFEPVFFLSEKSHGLKPVPLKS
jgi:hypothetical protein